LTEKGKHCRASLIHIDKNQGRPKRGAGAGEANANNDREKRHL
jgi:hypothetical protein